MNPRILREHITHAMQQPIPDRRFDLWEFTNEGQIFGFYWRDVESAWTDGSLPGWWYCVQYGQHDQSFYHESDLTLVEGVE